MIQPRKNGINHWVLHSTPIVLKELGLVGDFPTLHVLVSEEGGHEVTS